MNIPGGGSCCGLRSAWPPAILIVKSRAPQRFGAVALVEFTVNACCAIPRLGLAGKKGAFGPRGA